MGEGVEEEGEAYFDHLFSVLCGVHWWFSKQHLSERGRERGRGEKRGREGGKMVTEWPQETVTDL